jgi:hypothetical protein
MCDGENSCPVIDVSFDDLMQRFREHLGNRGYRRHDLDDMTYALVCAAADAIQDADQAIGTYLTADPSITDHGLLYLYTYGVLQAAYVQQDALIAMRRSFGLPADVTEDMPEPMQALRAVRNRTVGHPSSERFKVASFLQQFSLCIGNIDILTIEDGNERNWQPVQVNALLQRHLSSVVDWLTTLVEELDRKEQDHRTALAAKGSFRALLPTSTDYLVTKVNSAAHGPSHEQPALSIAAKDTLKKAIDEIISRLEDAGLGHDGPAYNLRAGLNRLDHILPHTETSEEARADVQAYAAYLEKFFKELGDVLSEIDIDLGITDNTA